MKEIRKKVLIAEDDEDIMFVLEAGLDNYEIISAYSGTEALAKLSEQKPDLIIMDIMMPELNGVELNMRLKEDPELKEIPVVVITGRPNMKEIFSSSGENSVSGFLEKPFTLEVLEQEIKRIIGV